MFLKDYRFGSTDRSNDRILFPKPAKTISTFSAIALFFCTNNGSNPYLTERFFFIGLINNIISSFVPCILVGLSFQAYIRTWRFNSETSFAGSLKDAFGGKSENVMRGMFIFAFFNNIMFNCYDVYKFTREITTYLWPNVKWVNSKYTQVYFLSLSTVIPTFFIKRFSQLTVYAHIANISVLITLVIMGVYAYKSVQVVGFNPTGETVLFTKDLYNSVNCLSYFVLIFYTHPIICNLAPEMNCVKQGDFVRVSWIANIISWLVNFVSGYLGWFTLHGTTYGSICLTLYPNSPLKCVACFFGLLNTIFTNGCLNYLNGIEITKLFAKDMKKVNPWTGVLVSVLFGIGCAVGPTFLMDYIAGASQFFFMIVCMGVPPAAVIKMFGIRNFWGFFCLIYIFVVLIIGSSSIYCCFTRPTKR